MKKSILALGLLLVVNQSNCGLFDDAMAFLKKNASSLFEKGKKYLSDNSDKILGLVQEKGGELIKVGSEYIKPYLDGGVQGLVKTEPKSGMGIQEAEKLVLDTAKTESDSQEKDLTTQAKSIVATTKGLTPAEQQLILQEAQNLANQNRTAFIKQAQESIAKKREALKKSIYDKYGKGTPIQ